MSEKKEYTGEGYSEEPGQTPRNARPIYGLVGRIPIEALYRQGKTNPHRLIGGGYR